MKSANSHRINFEGPKPQMPEAHVCDESCTSVASSLQKVHIEFEDPNNPLPREKKSKRLSTDSLLVKYLTCVRAKILSRFPRTKGNDRPWHIELCSKFTDYDTVIRRAQSLQGTEIDVKDPKNYGFMGNEDRAFVLNTGTVEGYGATHITVGFFIEPLSEQDKDWVKGLIV